MSNQQVLAEHGVGLCILGLGFSTAAAPLSSVALIGVALFDIWRNFRHTKRQAARDAGMARLASLGITDRQAEVALNYLKDFKTQFEVDPASLKDARTRGAFPQTLYDTLFDPKTIPADDRVPEALFAIVEGAWDVLRLEDDVHKLFTQESLSHLEMQLGTRFDVLEKRLAADIADLREMVEVLTRQLEGKRLQMSTTAQTLLDNENFIVALAFRYAEGSPQDLAAALGGLEHALEVAAEERERGKLLGNTDDAVNAVIAQADALNAAGQIDTAAALLAEEEARVQAGLIRLCDKGISQAVLTRDVEAAVVYELKKLPLEAPELDDHFSYLNGVFVEWCTRGDLQGLNFDAEVAIALMRHMVGHFGREPDKKDACLINLGVALQKLGARESGTARLEEAVSVYRAALEELSRDRVSLGWATAQMNLGATLATLGERERSTARLEESVIASRAALEELPRDRVPIEWATAQMNLGNALRSLGEQERGTARLDEAVSAYRAALEELTRDRVPLLWAKNQMNLGNALTNLGERERGTTRLEEAVSAYRAALEERPRDRVPLDWAMTQMNLGNTLRYLGERESGTARLEEAVIAFHAALQQWTRDRTPLEWANSVGSQGVVLLVWADRASDVSLAVRARDQLIESEKTLREGGHAIWAQIFASQILRAEALIIRLTAPD
ncbi:tetratricopeptide repeat protein [Pseudophaeobacter sp.]|uniref:tetratricopeptide repeat protein n=1 Tax=Pseudophaeobacter sp. TaxID=1971739 RepID=UPI003A96E09A